MQGSGWDREPRSWTARVLAPLALIASIAVVYLVISGDLGGLDGDGDDEPERTRSTTTSGECEVSDPDAVDDGYHVVTEDDTAGLSGIAAATCIPLDRLVKLNPELDPQTLQVQNCVDLVRDGCKALSE